MPLPKGREADLGITPLAVRARLKVIRHRLNLAARSGTYAQATDLLVCSQLGSAAFTVCLRNGY